MGDTTSRALLLLSLLQARRVSTGRELMARLGVSERTLRRDIHKLRDLGYGVHSISGPAGGYQLHAGANIPPLLLDVDEAVTIAVGLLTVVGGSIKELEETSVRALTKLGNTLSPGVIRRIDRLQRAVVPLVRLRATVDFEVLTTVSQACRDHERLRFEYRGCDSEETEVEVDPHHLIFSRQFWYLVAYDQDLEDWRTFRLDKVKSPRRIGFDSRTTPGGSAAEDIRRSIQSMPMRYQAVATVNAPASEIESKLRPGEAEVEPLDDEHCTVRLRGNALGWLAFLLIWLGTDFTIREPEELIDYVDNLSRQLADSVEKI